MPPWSYKQSQQSSALAAAQATAKKNILKAVSEAVSEVQYQYQNSDVPILSNEITARLCTAVEAVFVHGLKETFLGRLSSRLASHEARVSSPKMPEPSFWTFALVFSHKQVISQIDSLTQVSSEVGRARAWLRLAFNDGLLVSYLAAMVSDPVSLAVHYDKFAFLRDPDKRDLCLSYLHGISIYTFNLSVNVSTLNRWQPRPLVLAGWWVQSSSEVDIGGDVAAELVEEPVPAPDFVRTLAQPIRECGPGSYMRGGLLNEEEALRLILESTPVSFSPHMRESIVMKQDSNDENLQAKDDAADITKHEGGQDVYDDDTPSIQFVHSRSPSPNINRPDSPASSLLLPLSSPILAQDYSPSPEPMMPRSLTVSPTLEWDHTSDQTELPLSPASLAEELEVAQHETKSEEQKEDVKIKSPIETLLPALTPSPVPCFIPSPTPCSASPTQTTSSPVPCSTSPIPSPPRSPSNASVESCTCSSAGPQPDCPTCSTRTPVDRPQLVLSDTQSSLSQGTDLITAQTTRQRRLQGLGFSQTPSVRVASLSLAQNISLTSALDLVSQESGLDTQDWRCQDCGKAIGAIFGPGRLCGFTKKYYCDDCHTNTQTTIIPARLLYNWDGGQYKVARSSMLFLQTVSTKPFIDIRSFSPNLSKFAPCLDTSYRLRKQLTYLSAYLTACSRAGQQGVKVALAEVVWPREYLYTGTDLYSLRDMEQLFTGELITTLTTAVKLCVKHVTSCLVCSGRGFICELCKDKRPVYPFNLDTTSQCLECLTVFHSSCAAALSMCPKCERLEARSLNWHVANSKLSRETGS